MAVSILHRLKILILPPIHWEMLTNGPDQWRLFKSLESLGVDVEVLNPKKRPWNPFHGRGTFLQALDPLRALEVLIKKRGYDAVVVVFQAGTVPLLLLKRFFAFRVPVVVWDMNLEPGWRLGQWSMSLAAKRADLLMCLTGVQADYINTTFKPRQRPVIISHSVDEAFYRPSDEPDQNYVFTIGDDGGRDYDTLFAAYAEAERPLPLFVRSSRDLKHVPSGVKIIKDRFSYKQLRTYYAGSRYVLVPLKSTLNPSGVSAVLEAAAMGKPAIVSDVPSIRPFVRAGETALLVPPEDSHALADAIATLDANENMCRQMGENARRLVDQEYSVDAFAARFAFTLRTAFMI